MYVYLQDLYFLLNYYSTGTILEKDAYFSSLMDRHTSRLILCKSIQYTLYYHYQLQLQKGCKNIKQSKLLTQISYCQNFQQTSKYLNIEDLASDG